uniref:hypothetical protein n=1 Tax=Ensifer adhaerens TaxID=106592 RepID=UPI003F49901C
MANELDALILRNAVDIQRAYMRLIGEISTKVQTRIGRSLSEWVRATDWHMDTDADRVDDIGIWPGSWTSAAPTADDQRQFDAWFVFGAADHEVGDNWLLNLCAAEGHERLGLLWEPDTQTLGVRRRPDWTRFVKDRAAIGPLQELGFSFVGGGRFFFPCTVSADSLADAFVSENLADLVNSHVHEALNAAKQAKPYFDQLIEQAKHHFAARP